MKTVRYACGPACDAVAFVLEADAMLYLPQSPLPESVRVDQLPVRVVFERTGNRAGQWEGPEGLEKVRVLQIRPR
ncbi:MAG TPA: hypothetical protein PKE63_12135 [Lacibacter sp.]|nr:hypothetical protein [Lacibacter sp.]HMO87557.1 hypothetical protein [Lacibacter sp.]HMP88018.1 hypothetical protein [Lacibacter sp.]